MRATRLSDVDDDRGYGYDEEGVVQVEGDFTLRAVVVGLLVG